MDFGADELDELLGEAMRSRPEVRLREGVDLAQLAMEQVRAADARMADLTKLGRRMRWCSLAAGLLVVLVLAGGIYWYPASSVNQETANAATESVVEGSVQTSLETSTTATSLADWTTLGLAALALAAVGVTVRGVMVPERQGLRFAGA